MKPQNFQGSQSSGTTPSYILSCRMAFEAAALERLCQVLRIRGFRVMKMAVETVGSELNIELTLEGARPIEMLKSQLEKLHSVTEVALPRDHAGFEGRATLASG